MSKIYQIYGKKSQGSGVQDIESIDQNTVKFVENGQLYIRRNGQCYTILGTAL